RAGKPPAPRPPRHGHPASASARGCRPRPGGAGPPVRTARVSLLLAPAGLLGGIPSAYRKTATGPILFPGGVPQRGPSPPFLQPGAVCAAAAGRAEFLAHLRWSSGAFDRGGFAS